MATYLSRAQSVSGIKKEFVKKATASLREAEKLMKSVKTGNIKEARTLLSLIDEFSYETCKAADGAHAMYSFLSKGDSGF